jgi:uncharacterized membrane protein YsdA (DUF1294 family)
MRSEAVPLKKPYHYPIKTKQRLLSLLVALLFFGFMAYLVHGYYLHKGILYFYLGASVFTFLVYAKDKWSARSGRWRVSENSLQWFALAGGWPGALLAQYFLRHKSSKQSFTIVFVAMTIFNLGIFGVYLYALSTGNIPGPLHEAKYKVDTARK